MQTPIERSGNTLLQRSPAVRSNVSQNGAGFGLSNARCVGEMAVTSRAGSLRQIVPDPPIQPIEPRTGRPRAVPTLTDMP